MNSVKPTVELVWPGKDRDRAAPAVTGSDLALVERYHPAQLSSALDGVGAQLELSLATAAWRNLLVHGDNLVAMACLRERLAGAVDLIYIDPPYATGLSYYSQTGGTVERRAYRDALRGGNAAYIDALYERLASMHALLAPEGKIFVHCDWRASGMLRLVLDELFGAECFRNEIIWRRAPNLGRQAASRQLGRVFDSIFVYTKTPGAAFPGPVPKRRTRVALDGKGKPRGARWDEERKLYFTTAPRGDYTDKSIAELRQQGRVYDSATGTVYIKYFLTRGEDGRWYKDQPVDALWDDFEVRPLRHRPKAEDMGYDTQKPQGLLERIIGWATKPGDLVADFYGGSGTTAAVAAALGRRWISCDAGATAIEIGRRRLASAGHAFDVCSVERAERRLWAAELATRGASDVHAVLEGYGAVPTGGRWGERDGERVFVAPLAQVLSDDEVMATCREAGGARLALLAWEWGDEDAASLRARARAEHAVELTLRTIPMELARASAQAAPRFVERPEIALEVVDDGSGKLVVRVVGLRCGDPRQDEPQQHEAQTAIDAWRVDFDGDEPFSPGWQSARSGGAVTLETPPHRVRGARVRVKAFTVFGDEVAVAVPC